MFIAQALIKRSIWDIKSDTLKVKGDCFSNEILIVIPRTNMFNFLHLYDISTGEKIGIDSTSCLAEGFLTLKIKKSDRRNYLLWNWGFHYGRTIHLTVE